MRVSFYVDPVKTTQVDVCRLLSRSIRACGDEATVYQDRSLAEESDVGVIFGVAGESKRLLDEHRTRNKSFLFVDKGYLLRKNCFRISANGFHPWRLVKEARYDPVRLESFRIKMRPWSDQGDQVLVAGTSAKFCTFCGLGDPNEAHKALVNDCLSALGGPVWYRPKHTWTEATPLQNCEFDQRPLSDALDQAKFVTTYASNVSVDAMIHGVPVAVLGDGVLKYVCPDNLSDLRQWQPSEKQRSQTLSNLAWCQWRRSELQSASTWFEIRRQLDGDYPT